MYTAFWELSTCRASGFDIGPISWTSIKDYAIFYGLTDTPTEFERFHFLIREMDNEFLKFRAQKSKSEREKQEREAKSKGKRAAHAPTTPKRVGRRM